MATEPATLRPDRPPPLLEVVDLQTHFFTEDGVVRSVDGVTFEVEASKTLGIVGESGCGKSITALSTMRLIDSPGCIVGGEIRFEERNLLELSEAEIRAVRGNEIAMIFQEPMTSLNPVYTVGFQIGEAIRLHTDLSGGEVRARVVEMLRLVGIPSAEQRLDDYPHQMSGGMRQRVMIAMALSCNPKVLIADEPTTALDVTIQAQTLNLMRKLQKEFKTAIILITHDLGIVAETADDVVVMYMGKIVERASTARLFDAPKHPYTVGLLRSTPKLEDDNSDRLPEIRGTVPGPFSALTGCRFHPRCERATEICRAEEPDLVQSDSTSWVRCWHANGMSQQAETSVAAAEARS